MCACVYVSVECAYVNEFVPCVGRSHEGQKRASNALELEVLL